jgi:Aspartyl protease
VIETRREGPRHVVEAEVTGPGGKAIRAPLLIDTGATSIVLPSSMIPPLGLKDSDLRSGQAQTAGGIIDAGRVPGGDRRAGLAPGLQNRAGSARAAEKGGGETRAAQTAGEAGERGGEQVLFTDVSFRDTKVTTGRKFRTPQDKEPSEQWCYIMRRVQGRGADQRITLGEKFGSRAVQWAALSP